MANVVKFVKIVPPIQIDRSHNNAKYTVYPNMHFPNLSFWYICSDTCEVNIYSDDPEADGCPHAANHKDHICRIEGEEAEVDSWIANNFDKVTELTTNDADTLGKLLAPERPGEDENGDPITIPEFDINDYL